MTQIHQPLSSTPMETVAVVSDQTMASRGNSLADGSNPVTHTLAPATAPAASSAPNGLIGTVASKDQKTSSSGSSAEYIFIHSHRRSGTHLLIDTVSSWFDVVPGFCHFPTLDNTVAEGEASTLHNTRLVKSHEPIYGFQLKVEHLWKTQHHLNKNRRLYENNPHIYIVRNPFLVLRSLYVFDLMGAEDKFKVARDLSFRGYLLSESMHEANGQGKNRMKYWEQHVVNWASRSDVLIIDYDDLLQSTTNTAKAISHHVKSPIRSSQRPVSPTGIARGLTDRFLKGGLEPVWEPDIINLMEATIEHLAAVQPRIGPLVERWLAAAPSVRATDTAANVSLADDLNSGIQGRQY
jgi:hypothetical protein